MDLIKRILIKLLKYFLISIALLVLIVFSVPYFNDSCKNNSAIKDFDVIIVLGNPATVDCKPSSIMKNRVDKGIELFNLGYAEKILFTGSSVRNNCTEADVMAAYAISKGIPKSSIIKEQRAQNTYQNAYYSVAQMNILNFTTAAIVTSQPHVKRSCAVFSEFDIKYTLFGADFSSHISKTQLMLWQFGERMILTHHIIFGHQKELIPKTNID